MSNFIVQNNLRRMTGAEEGQLGYLKMFESMGGNAGRSCYAANFYFDEASGTIVYFGNHQQVPPTIRARYMNAAMRIEVSLKKRGEKIIGLLNGHFTPKAKANLEETIRVYNEMEALKREN